MLPDQFALLLTDFFKQFFGLGCLGIVENIETDGMAFPLRFRKNTVLAF